MKNNRHTQQSHLPTSLQLRFLTAREHLEVKIDKPRHTVSFKHKPKLTKPTQISSTQGTETFNRAIKYMMQHVS